MIAKDDELVKEFIRKHARDSVADLSLKLSKQKDLPRNYILRQINGLQRAREKFPSLIDQDYQFPAQRAIEQASSETAARFKAEQYSGRGEKLADLSGGMGIDSLMMAERTELVDYVEKDPELFEISSENFKRLGANNVHSFHRSAEEHLEKVADHSYDLIYLDPDRRIESKRAYRIEDCEPNVSLLLPQLLKKAKRILIKLSPMIDLQSIIRELHEVKEIYILSIANECKEVLVLIEKDFQGETLIKSSDLQKSKSHHFHFSISEEARAKVDFSPPLNYLYEANAAILKSGAFNLIAERFKLKKIAVNTHLYTSDTLISDFPGRKMKILQSLKKPKKQDKINVVCRNAGISANDLKKKFKLKDGGDQFLYAFRNQDQERIYLLTEKV